MYFLLPVLQFVAFFCYVFQDKETDIEKLRKQLAEKDDFIKELKQQVDHESLQSMAKVPLPEDRQDEIDQSVNKEVWFVMESMQ